MHEENTSTIGEEPMTSGIDHEPSQEFHNKLAGKAFIEVIGWDYFGDQLYKAFLEHILGRGRGDR